MKLSIVIPTLNEAAILRQTIEHTFEICSHRGNLEIIVVDNGSSDHTLTSISDLDVRVFERPELKGKKYAILNFGGEQAKGEVILFLDADTLLPHHFDQLIEQSLSNLKIVGGAFDFEFTERRWYLQTLAFFNRIRIRLDHNFLGDQALFCRKPVFGQVGGYPEKLIMESSFLCQALKKQGKLAVIPARVHTSARRFLEHGFLKVFWYDFKVWTYYVLGLNADKFGKAYWQHNDLADE